MFHLKSSTVGAGVASLALVSFTGFAQEGAKSKEGETTISTAHGSITITGRDLKAIKNADGSFTITGNVLKFDVGPAVTRPLLTDVLLAPKTGSNMAYEKVLNTRAALAKSQDAYKTTMLKPADKAPITTAGQAFWQSAGDAATALYTSGGATSMTTNGRFLYICQGTKCIA